MAKYRFFTVGFDLPGEDFEYVPFDSDQTLLDADIILFEPMLGAYSSYEGHNGRPLLSESSSFATKESLNHWRSEIVASVNAGKLVIIYLAKPIECYRHTGQKQFSGTGRSRVTTNLVTEISSYEAVPKLKAVGSKTGKEIRLEKDASYLVAYWKEFSSYSPYEAVIEGDFSRVLLRSRAGQRIVGAAIHSQAGVLLFLPPIRYDLKEFVRADGRSKKKYWTEEALIFGKKLAASLSGLATTLKESTQVTPEPSWTVNSAYRFTRENELELNISAVSSQIAKLQPEKAVLERDLRRAGGLRRLLYEQSKPLENSILEALTLLGFGAKPFADGESEFDAVFESPEGRCLGEAKGKDNKAVNIDKLSQLERNIQEDFARDEVKEYAKGVLFGNAFRLSPLEDRGKFFTEKCVSGAKRARVALIRTPDLFGPAKYLKEHPEDIEYAALCRKAIYTSEGAVVDFPMPPVADTKALSVTDKNRDKATELGRDELD
jgi:hypothetical protein